MSNPQIIRSLKELKAVDPDTVLDSNNWDEYMNARYFLSSIEWDSNYLDDLPVAVVATGPRARAARKALEGLRT